MMYFDYLIVGCGITGASIARNLADAGYKVEIIDRRDHIGGNMYDYVDEHGILVHKYGPHCFHTNNERLIDYIRRYADWDDFRITCGAVINGKCTPSPFNYQTIDDFYQKAEAEDLKRRIERTFSGKKTVPVLEALSCDDEVIQKYARFLFDNDYSLYTAKQWGISANEIDPSVIGRVPLRFDYNNEYFDDEFQVIPSDSYAAFFNSLLDHPNIFLRLKTEAVRHIAFEDGRIIYDGMRDASVIYTGALDELFDLKYGELPYRSLEFQWKYENTESKQDMTLVAYPQEPGYTRIVEYKKMFPKRSYKGTSYGIEYPKPYKKEAKNEPYYPVLTEDSKKKYDKYRKLANSIENLICCGRLADFKYYNMDQALERALCVSDAILKKEGK